MTDNAHDLQLAVLVWQSASRSSLEGMGCHRHLESFILQHALDGGIFAVGSKLGMKDHAKGPVPDDLALGVLHLSGLPRHTILNLFPNDFCTDGQ